MPDPPVRLTTQRLLLLVDDDEIWAQLVHTLIERYAADLWVLHTAASVTEALEILQQHHIDLLLLDLNLLMTNGIETLLGMLKAAPTTPIVVLTGGSDEETERQSITLGAVGFFNKNAAINSPRAFFEAVEHCRTDYQTLRQGGSSG